MKYCLLLMLLALCGPLSAGLMDVKASLDPQTVAPGNEVRLRLQFSVREGFHTYHKDNPGYGKKIDIAFTQLSGLTQKGDPVWPKWHEWKDKDDPKWVEYELSGDFEIVYTFTVPAGAKDKLKIAGKFEGQACDEKSCTAVNGTFGSECTITAAKPDELKLTSGELIAARATLVAEGGRAAPGKEVTLKLHFVVADTFHVYAKDNPGIGRALSWEFAQLSGLTQKEVKWPEHHVEFPDAKDKTWIEWVLTGEFDIVVTFTVPQDAKGSLSVAGSFSAQVCDADACHDKSGEFSADIAVDSTIATTTLTDAQLRAKWKVSSIKRGPDQQITIHKNGAEIVVLRPTWVVYFTGNTRGYALFDQLEEGVSRSEVFLGDQFAEVRVLRGGSELDLEAVPLELVDTSGVKSVDEATLRDQLAKQAEQIRKLEAELKELKRQPASIKDEHGFFTDFEAASAEAKASGKQLMVDFNGKFCPPCRRMERDVFPMPEVQEVFKNFVLVSLQTDVKDAKADAVFARYSKLSKDGTIPLFVVMDADGNALRSIGATLGGEGGLPKTDFVRFLKGEIGQIEGAKPPEQTEKLPDGWPKGLPGPANDITKERFTVEAKFSAEKVKPGGEVTLELRFKCKSPEGGPIHLYHPKSPHAVHANFDITPLAVIDAAGLEPAGDWEFPKHEVVPAEKSEFGDEEWRFGGEFTVVRRYKVPASTKPGAITLTGTFQGQSCNERGCYKPPKPFGWFATMNVAADGVDKAVVTAEGGSSGDGGSSDDGMLWFLLAAFLGGMATLLTPCVLPVLPLTIGFFVKQSEQKRSPLITAGIYCACILISFTLFGLLTSLILGKQGAQIIATNGYVNLALALLFLTFALSFFGLFELRVPTFISSKISRAQFSAQQQQKGYVAAALSGSSFSVISFSCSAPIAAAILALAAGGHQWQATLAMLAYASGMAVPIFIMGQFPSLLKKMPKSGGWMNALKVSFAFIELALAARYFAWAEMGFKAEMAPTLVSRNIVVAIWIVCSALAGLYLLGMFRLPHDHEKVEQLGVVRMIFATLFLVFGLYMVPGLLGSPMGYLDGILPPAAAGQGGGVAGGKGNKIHDLPWHDDLDEGLAEAKKTGKPVFVDFTGILCSNCRWVETNILPADEVYKQLKDNFVLVQQWTDKDSDPKAKANWEKYGGAAVPFYVILDADGHEITRKVPPQFINNLTPEEFAAFLSKGRSSGQVAK